MNLAKYRVVAYRWWRQEIRPFLIFALVMFAARSSLADWNDVPTGSMKPTILEGDRVFVNKLAYDLKRLSGNKCRIYGRSFGRIM
jgi:signal peptidase I